MDIKMNKMGKINNFKSPNLLDHRGWRRYLTRKGSFLPLKFILITVLISVIATVSYIYVSYGKQSVDSDISIANETDNLTARIGKFMDLPAEEQPALVTVTDKAKLRGQDFFEHAQDGDKLLVYTRAKKVILYRPSTGKIIDVTNLTSGGESSQ